MSLSLSLSLSLSQRTEREIQQQLEAQEEERVEVQGNYQSLQEEATVKEKKLKKVCTSTLVQYYMMYH